MSAMPKPVRAAYYQRPESKAKAAAYYQRPEIKAKAAAYRQRPEIKAAHNQYQNKRNAELRRLAQLAIEAGLT